MKQNNFIKTIVLIAGVAYVYKISKSKTGLLSGLGISPNSILSAALPVMGIRNPIVSTIINEGAKGIFNSLKKPSYAVIDAEYKRVK